MNRFPRAARNARVKCIGCNAPAVETTDGGYVCVACGQRPLAPRRPTEVIVERGGIRVVKRILDEGRSEATIGFTIDSLFEVPVSVRIRQPVEDPSVAVELPMEPVEWTRTATGLECSRVLEPGETVETSIVVRYPPAASAPLADDPTVEAVNVIDASVVGRPAAPSWRGGLAGTVGATTATATGKERTTVGDGGQQLVANGAGTQTLSEEAAADDHLMEAVATTAECEDLPVERPSRPESRPESSDYLLPPESDQSPTISVVLPTMNEEDGIGPCIEAVISALEELEIHGEIVVSDSSSDRTPEIAAGYGANVVTPDRDGYGAAYQYGFEHARGEYLVMGDADTTYDFEELPKLFGPVVNGEADIVMGSRFAGEIKPGAMPWLHRRIGNPLLTKFLNTFYTAEVTDAHSGFRVVRRDALDQLELQSDGMEFASEMVMAAGEAGLTIEEVPITYHPRVGEAKLDSLSDGWRHVKFMLTNTPTYVFSLPAVGIAAVGLVTMALALLDSQLFGVTFGTHAVIAGSMLTIIGYQVGSLAVFSAVAGTAIRSPNDPVTSWIRDHFALEHGATIGLGLYAIGAGYVALMAVRWVSSGYSSLPFVEWNMVAFTVIVIGVQTLFYSFFLSLLGQRSVRALGN